MAAIDEHLTYYRNFRDQIKDDIHHYESGAWFTGEIKNGERIDRTADKIKELKKRLIHIEQIIAAYEEQKRKV